MRRERLMRGALVAALAWCVAAQVAPTVGVVGQQQRGAASSKSSAVNAAWAAALERVSAESLRGHLSFVASDALEGRNTPSRGLDVAAEYIAAQFRRAGLEPAGEAGGYFQTTTWGEAVASAGSRRRQPTAEEAAQKVRNVAGLLRGSDAALKDTYVIVSAHYDHVGVRPDAGGEDKIFNGANDDGSGTVSVVELASALASLKQRPKRSILFVAFFGEEKGLVGSRYYGRRPLVPLEKTIAQLNLEHLGRTDDTEGPQVGTVTMTGFDYTDLGATLERAGAATGVKPYKHARNSDAFFGRSDNQALADLGIPAHTLCTAFTFPDYHGAGDHWEKIDYDNMARVVRTVGLTLLLVADNPQAPKWDDKNPNAAKYVEAWRKLQGK
jgi:Peptidase family M28